MYSNVCRHSLLSYMHVMYTRVYRHGTYVRVLIYVNNHAIVTHTHVFSFPYPQARHLLYYVKTIRETLLLSLQPLLFMRGLIKRFCGQLFPVDQFAWK